MARPPCPRRIEHRPPAHYFKPAGIPLRDLEEIALAADELEAMRLADCEGLYNQDAAKCMGVSRQTFDRIIHRAHQKTARALVNGFALRIEKNEQASDPLILPSA
ncbi:MAG: DUF134 domain-containing protein [Verrucomicrobiota bacterium]